MTVNERIPDYDLEDMVVVTAPGQLRALADPLRGIILELLLERAASVTEMARAVGRPEEHRRLSREPARRRGPAPCRPYPAGV